MLRAPFRARRLQKRTEAQWDMRPWLRADGGANESMSLQLGIRLIRASADSVVGQAASSNSRESERRAINTACRGRPRDVAGAILSGWPLPIFAAAKSG